MGISSTNVNRVVLIKRCTDKGFSIFEKLGVVDEKGKD